MTKELNLYGLITLILSITLVSVLGINYLLLQYGVGNDYILYNLQEISEQFEADGIVQSNTSNMTLLIAETYQDTINWYDDLWFGFYIMLFIGTIVLAYNIKEPTEMNFLSVLLFGIFIFLFIGYLFNTLVSWFTTEVTLKLLPNAFEFFPKYQWYINNVGVINFFHALILLLVSRINLQLINRSSINEQEVGGYDEYQINDEEMF